MLCAWADEQFEAAPWGAEGAGLLLCFHGEAHRGDKLLRLLARLAEKPSEHRALLELFHTCLSLGLRASTALDNHDHENLRSRVYLAVQQALLSGTLHKQGCEVCGRDGVAAHHDRNDEPLDFRWLCRRCHVKLHHYG